MKDYFNKCQSVNLSASAYNALDFGLAKTFALRCGLYELSQKHDNIVDAIFSVAALHNIPSPEPLFVNHRGYGLPKRLFFLQSEHDTLSALMEAIVNKINSNQKKSNVSRHVTRLHWDFMVQVVTAFLQDEFGGHLENTRYYQENIKFWKNPQYPLSEDKPGVIKKEWFQN